MKAPRFWCAACAALSAALRAATFLRAARFFADLDLVEGASVLCPDEWLSSAGVGGELVVFTESVADSTSLMSTAEQATALQAWARMLH